MNDEHAPGSAAEDRRRSWWRAAESRNARTVALLVPVLLFAYFAVKRRWMDDDGFINLRVVQNVLAGRGPVYNVGERVEVGTSPLWIAAMALFGALRLRLEYVAVWLGIASAVSGLVLAMRASLAIDRVERPAPVRVLTLPVGALTLAVLPPCWEYASSGLETGLMFLWLGGSFALLVEALDSRATTRRIVLSAVLIGLGPLVRPEGALYSAAMLVPLALRQRIDAISGQEWRRGRQVVFVAGLAAAALALPLAYQIFRMGYYGALAPNTSIAKESTLAYWKQGYCYAQNFFGRYRLGWPLLLAGGFFVARVLTVLAARQRALAAVLLLLPLAAAIHGLYIVRVGGDYMHARMFLPVVFAALLPVMTARIALDRSREAMSLGVLGLALVPWWILCGVKLRVPRENQCGIGDEHGWYMREAKVAHPVTIEDYAKHDFGKIGHDLLQTIDNRCPDHARCRQLFFGERDHGNLFPWRAQMPVAPDLDPRVQAVVEATAIGIVGYQLPWQVHVVDQLGLADPVAARVRLKERARPGHEKDLYNAWVVALFGAPMSDEDVSVKAARRALSCGPLADLVKATRGPLTAAGFWSNVRNAATFQALRIPPDPFDAEAELCHVSEPDVATAGGTGGNSYRWQCPPGGSVMSMTGALDKLPKTDEGGADELIERVIYLRVRCTLPGEVTRATRRDSPLIGKEHESNFELACPPGSVAVGMKGRAGDKIEKLALSCARVDPSGTVVGAVVDTGAVGGGGAEEFDLPCAAGKRMIGVLGRSGDWLDSLGPVCDSVPASGANPAAPR